MTIKEQYHTLLKLVNEKFPSDPLIVENAQTGANSSELAPVFSTFQAVDEQLVELLKIRNGDSGAQLFPPVTLFSAIAIVENLGSLIRLYKPVNDDPGWEDPYRFCDPKPGWKADWIPFADSNTEPLFVDMCPGPNGRRGQIVCAHSSRELCVQAWSLSNWFTYVIETVKQSDRGSDLHILTRDNP